MVDRLNCRIGTLSFKNPIIIGSGPLTNKLSRIKKAEDHGAAAVSLKHAMVHDPLFTRPRWYSDRVQGLVNPGDPRLKLEEGLDLTRQVKESCDLVVLANMSGRTDEVESWGKAAQQFEEAGADAIEVNFTCPNLGLGSEDGVALGSLISKSPSLVFKITETIRKAVRIPVIPKLGLGSGSGDLFALGAACERAGADSITLIASERAAPDIDILDGGKPLVWGAGGKASFGAYAGSWKRLITCRYVGELAPRTHLPIIAGGGISTASDIVKVLMYGATLIHIVYAPMVQGFGLIEKLLAGLEDYLDETGYARLQDVRGLTLNYIAEGRNITYDVVAAQADTELCNGCGICERIGSCDAIQLIGEKAVINTASCVGCGLCRGVCPKRAIRMEMIS